MDHCDADGVRGEGREEAEDGGLQTGRGSHERKSHDDGERAEVEKAGMQGWERVGVWVCVRACVW